MFNHCCGIAKSVAALPHVPHSGYASACSVHGSQKYKYIYIYIYYTSLEFPLSKCFNNCPLLKFHIFISPLLLPVINLRPDLSNIIQEIPPPICNSENSKMNFPVVRSHNFKMEPSHAVTTQSKNGLYNADLTDEECVDDVLDLRVLKVKTVGMSEHIT